MPFALDEIRKLGETGHSIYASDTFHTAPGSHSKFVAERIITAPPTQETLRFLEELKQIIRKKSIDLLIPMFEESFYIAKHLPEFTCLTDVFLSPFETLERFHNKIQFLELCAELSIRAPRTITATDDEELRTAVKEFDQYLARAVYSRGGVELLTNVEPLEGTVPIEDCHPTRENPWLVQEYVHGTDVCSFSIVQNSRVAAHCTYVHPKIIEHSGGIQFVSVDKPETLALVETFAEATGFHGQVSFDYMEDPEGLCMIECNPRPTDGVTLMPSEMFAEAVLNKHVDKPKIVKAGRKKQIEVAIVRDMIYNWREIPSDVKSLVAISDVYFRKNDMIPALYQFLSYSHVRAYRKFLQTGKHKRTDIMAAQFYDICWDGSPIP